MEDKIKRWVAYDDEYPGGMVFETREDALEYSSDARYEGYKCYVRVKYYTPEELAALPEAD